MPVVYICLTECIHDSTCLSVQYSVPCVSICKCVRNYVRVGGPCTLSQQAAGTLAPASGGSCLSVCPCFRWQGTFSCRIIVLLRRSDAHSSGSAAPGETGLLSLKMEGAPEIKTRMIIHTPSPGAAECVCVYWCMHGVHVWICMQRVCSLQYFGISKAHSSHWNEPEKKGIHCYFYIILPKGMLI